MRIVCKYVEALISFCIFFFFLSPFIFHLLRCLFTNWSLLAQQDFQVPHRQQFDRQITDFYKATQWHYSCYLGVSSTCRFGNSRSHPKTLPSRCDVVLPCREYHGLGTRLGSQISLKSIKAGRSSQVRNCDAVTTNYLPNSSAKRSRSSHLAQNTTSLRTLRQVSGLA